MDPFLSFRGSRAGHFLRVCGRVKAPPPCSRLRFAPASQGLPQPQTPKWHGPPASHCRKGSIAPLAGADGHTPCLQQKYGTCSA